MVRRGVPVRAAGVCRWAPWAEPHGAAADPFAVGVVFGNMRRTVCRGVDSAAGTDTYSQVEHAAEDHAAYQRGGERCGRTAVRLDLPRDHRTARAAHVLGAVRDGD